jgi:hypothetical protein
MTPQELVKALESFRAVGDQVDVAARSGARSAVKGVRVRGHRVSMSGSKIRVIGPAAPEVAKYLVDQAGKGAQAAVRRSLP